MNSATRVRRLPLPGNGVVQREASLITPFAIRYSEKRHGRGRPPGPTTLVDDYTEAQALHICERSAPICPFCGSPLKALGSVPLMTAIQYAVAQLYDDEFVLGGGEYVGADPEYAEWQDAIEGFRQMYPLDQYCSELAVRRVKALRKWLWPTDRTRSEAKPIIRPLVVREHPAVKRNYERMIRHYQGPRF